MRSIRPGAPTPRCVCHTPKSITNDCRLNRKLLHIWTAPARPGLSEAVSLV
jgi:hypothetical protein